MEKYKKRRIDSKNCVTQIHAVASSLLNLWTTVFGSDNLKTLTAIKKQISREMKAYDRIVNSKKFSFENFRLWREKNNKLFDILKPGTELSSVLENFYRDQLSTRLLYVSDFQFENDPLENPENTSDEAINMEIDTEDDNSSDYDADDTEDNESENDQNMACIVTRKSIFPRDGSNDLRNEEEKIVFPQVKLRPKKRNFSQSVHKAILKTISATGVTIEQARKAFVIISNEHFMQKYTLGLDSQVNENAGRPLTKNDYSKYCDVIPSWTTISEQRHKFALSKLIS